MSFLSRFFSRRRPPSVEELFCARCAMCEASECGVHMTMREGLAEFGVCRGCPCSRGKCEACGHEGEHWIHCPRVRAEETEGAAFVDPDAPIRGRFAP